MGHGPGGPAFAPRSTSVALLGPTRMGKTSSVVVPAVLTAPGPVISTSTKTDVMEMTARARSRIGPCFLYDPTGGTRPPRGVELLRWSPVSSCRDWSSALITARSLVTAARIAPLARGTGGGVEDGHWVERAESMLAVLMHAAALADLSMAEVVAWVDTRRAAPAFEILDQAGVDELSTNALAGLAATEQRELSGIWSTASRLVGAYRTREALESTSDPSLDTPGFLASSGTIYVCATGRHQAFAAPMVIGLLNELVAGAYQRFREADDAARDAIVSEPLLLALDEAANIAPLPDLPSVVSEGGGQGVVVLACLQDLSQAEERWGMAPEAFLAKFTTTLMLPGIRHVPTLQAFSALAGDTEIPTRSATFSFASPGLPARSWASVTRRLTRTPAERSETISTSFRPRLGLDDLAHGRPGHALVLGERALVGEVQLTPCYTKEPFASAISLGREQQAPAGPDGHHRDKRRERSGEVPYRDEARSARHPEDRSLGR